MAWRGPRTAHDQTLSTKGWAKVKAHWIRLQLRQCQATRCLLPGVPIDYAPPYTKRTSFSCGHIVPRWKAKALGWSVEQINGIANTRPEHAYCGKVDGARMGQQRQRAKIKVTLPAPVVPPEYNRW